MTDLVCCMDSRSVNELRASKQPFLLMVDEIGRMESIYSSILT